MGSFYVLLAIFLWSSLGVVVRVSGVEIRVLIFYSIIVSLIVQGLIIIQKKYRDEIPSPGKMLYPAILGIVTLLNSLTFYYAFLNTTIANAILTHYTAPIIVALLAVVFLKEKISTRIIVVLMLSSVGLWIMLNGFSPEKRQVSGIVAGVLSGITYAFIIIFVRMHSQKFNPLMLAFFSNLTIAILLAPFAGRFPPGAAWSFLFVGIVHSTIAPILYYEGLRTVSANRAAVLGYLEPVCAIIFSMIFLKEIPGVHSILGGALIVFSGYLTISDKRV